MTGNRPYTDEDAALAAHYVPLGFTERDPYRNVDEAARALLDAVAPSIIRRAKAEGWDEGYEAGYQMARSWGHVDYWEGEPANPYADEIEAAK